MPEMEISLTFGTFINLSAATGASSGASIEIGGAPSASMQTVITGAPATVQVDLEGSNDGVTWVQLATTTAVGGAIVFSVDKPVRFIRSRLVSLGAGTSPTVTTILSVSF